MKGPNMDALLERARGKDRAAAASAAESYRKLLRRASDPEPGDVETLASVRDTLGLTLDQVQSDLYAVREAARARAGILSVKAEAELRADADDEEAEAEADFRAECKRFIDALEL